MTIKDQTMELIARIWPETAVCYQGDWADRRFAGFRCADAVICDPPYGARTHAGQRTGSSTTKSTITYDAWTNENVYAFVKAWAPKTTGWIVAMTSHDLIPAWEKAFDDAGRYVFAPLPWINKCAGPRQSGDGPASAACWIVCARPKAARFMKWGSLPGYYETTTKDPEEQSARSGGKPRTLMREIIRDYSEHGDLIVDPFAGGGTTLMAAREIGRIAVGFEIDEKVALATQETLKKPWQSLGTIYDRKKKSNKANQEALL